MSTPQHDESGPVTAVVIGVMVFLAPLVLCALAAVGR